MEQIARAENPANLERARTFLHLLADVWFVDQGFYQTIPSKKKGFCPVYQVQYFRRMLNHSGLNPEDNDLDSAPTQKRPFKALDLTYHINMKRGHYIGYDLFTKFLSGVHGMIFN